MSDLSQELAALVADTLAAAESWRVTGAFLAPTGPLAGLPAAEPWPAGPAPRLPPPRPEPARFEQARVEQPRAEASRPEPTRPPPRPVEAARPAVAPRVEAPRAVAPAVRPVEPAPAPASGAAPNLAGLFGAKWQQSIRNPEDDITQALTAAARCPSCGAEAPSLRGAGAAESKLAVLAAGPDGKRLVGEAGVMFDKMLVHVLSLERADVWVLEANACATEGPAVGTCRGVLLRQLEIVGPRLLLAMGNPAAAIVGVSAAGRGDWARWRTTDVVATFHPVELVARPGEKGATMKHLTTLRQRL
ncbi:MAG: uracil-DNA glycosylase family protein [Myxococcota bacterium]